MSDSGRRTVPPLNAEGFPFIPNSAAKIRQQMLQFIGADSVEDLYSDIPREVRVHHPLNIPGFDSELEVERHIQKLHSMNKSSADFPVFLGAGIYDHHIPAAVNAILSRVEFQTAYTPYQAEISQGLLQALFEFQSLVADLTGMDAVNSSLYDGSNALGEAARMASRVTHRHKILVPVNTHPDKLSVLRNYAEPSGMKVETVDFDKETGGVKIEELQSKLNTEVAAVYHEVPTFFGTLDPNAASVPDLAHSRGALSIVGFDPISLGGLKRPGDYGADIAIAEGQSISSQMNYGGPLLGIMGCRGDALIRQLPGRLIGKTTTLDGKSPAYCMVLQTREQHIRREKATSNICTNEALMAIGAAAYLVLLGPHGLRRLFNTILTRTAYAIKRLSEVPGLSVPLFSAAHYQEFVVRINQKGSVRKASELNKKLLSRGVHGGKVLTNDFPTLGESSLFCVTEVMPTDSIDQLSELLTEIVGA